MTSYKLKKVMEHIAAFAYPDMELSPFYVEYDAKECTTVNATYHTKKKKIRIYNFSRPITNIMCSAIHELSHHICYERSGNSTHDIEFYRTFKSLLSAAVEIGYVDYEKCRKVTDTDTVKKMEEKTGRIYSHYDAEHDPNRNYCTMQVIGGYSIRNYLAKENFHYSSLERIWEKDMTYTESEKYTEKIRELDRKAKIVVSAINDLSIQVYYTVRVAGNTYQHREILKAHGYRYDSGNWYKKFRAIDFQEESMFLKELAGIEFKIM